MADSKSNNARSNSSRSGGRSQNKNTTTKKSTGQATKKKQISREEELKKKQNEIYFFIAFAVTVFLFCSNFGWCGFIGNFFSDFLFGLFGVVEYILPIYMFITVAFLLSNGVKKSVIKRVLCIGLFVVAAAFIFQLIAGLDEANIKTLYIEGYGDKKGGGVIFGGLLLLLYNSIGMTGCIIVISLLIIIGIIIVLNVSLIDIAKNSFNTIKEKTQYSEEDEEDDDYEESKPVSKKAAVPVNTKQQDLNNNLKVFDNKEKKKKKSKYLDEEMTELKPLKGDDFFSKFELDDSFEANGAKIDGDMPPKEEISVLEPEKRRRKKTKASYEEMIAERDSIAADINNANTISDAVDEVALDKEKSDKSKKVDISAVDNDFTKKDVVPDSGYKLPPLSLLKSGSGSNNSGGENEIKETAIKLQGVLQDFGVNVSILGYSRGPSVTRYEFQPQQGVKVNKIVNLADDIMLNMAATGIRIEAPIPGKAAVGIELPNNKKDAVCFRDLLESPNYKNHKSNIAFAVGKDISGQVIVEDIAKMPHLMVAGATGSGKSVCINTLIMSILYRANPDDVKLIMIDPKQVELKVYNDIPHMLIPVVTDPKKAAGALNWAVMEMTDRYNKFAQYNVRNLEGYNAKVKSVTGSEQGNEELKKLPQIVIIVDELADLMMVAHGEVEDAIVRLSQLARAAGIHMVIATQRPSVDVITGLIKANVPSRIAMKVSSGIDSRTILDQVGAEKLLGNGDMLFYLTGYSKPIRVQGAYLSDEEIVNVVEFLKAQTGEAKYDASVTEKIESAKDSGSASGSSGASDSEYDEYFVDAGKFIISKDKASIGMLQRVFKIGFNRAARIMDQLSEAEVVGPEEGTKPRKVLMTEEEFENFVENNL